MCYRHSLGIDKNISVTVKAFASVLNLSTVRTGCDFLEDVFGIDVLLSTATKVKFATSYLPAPFPLD